MSPQAQKLKDILNLLSDSLTKKDFLDAFKAVTEYVKKVDTRTASEVAQIKDMLTSTMERLKELHKEEVGSLESSMSKKMESDMNKMLLEHEAMMAECDKKMAEMKDGEDGMDADEEKIVADVLAKLPPPKELAPETPESVRDKLETLEGDERLDKKYIKGLQEEIDKLRKEIRSNTPISGGTGHMVKAYDLSSQLNGVTTTFNLPAMWRVISVHLSSVPNILRETVDYTWTPTSITFTAQIEPSTTLASGQTCIITYSE